MSRDRIADRLAEAGLSTERFIQCQAGQKASVDHTRRSQDAVSGEYGIYAMASDGLAILDIDDYGDDLEDRSGLAALRDLPMTLEQASPHGGTHQLFAVEPADDGRLVSDVLDETFGAKNPKPSWGEVRTANQYVVGAGSQLNGCGKDWCDECEKPDGGKYELKTDREIATVDVETFVDVLAADPNLSVETEAGESASADADADVGGVDAPDHDADPEDILAYARKVDDKLDRLWRGDYSDYGGDRSEAESALAMKLGFWFQGDKRTVRRMMNKARPEKWDQREDESYRSSVLEAVDQLDGDYYDPSEHSVSDPAEFDPEEVERGVAIMNAETGPESPAGELQHQNGCYGYEKVYRDDEGNITDTVFDTVVNFTIETLSYLHIEDGTQLKLRIHPQHPMEDSYDVRVKPSAFNSPQTFKEEIVKGRTTTFEPSNRYGKPTQAVLGDLRRTAGSQMAPQREGREWIGLSDDYSEWVTPEGSLTGDGWAGDPDYEYYQKTGQTDESGAVAQKWQPERDDGADYERADVREMLELLPQIRKTDRGLPILGWFYAAPLKPLITEWSGEFNLLEVTGETGSGKTTTLQAYWQLFGADTNPFSASDTGFTIEKHMAESCGLPVWIDEYKPADIPGHRLDRLHRRLREVTRERTISKGTQTLDEITFTIRAPVVISGEQKFKEAAVRRRAVMTNLTQAATDDGTATVEAYGELTGTSYEDANGDERYPNGYDLEQHALAYYQWLLDQNAGDLEEWWNDAKGDTKEILGSLGITVENTEQQGLQTVVFGTDLFRRFAEAHGVTSTALPAESELRAAVRHVVGNIGRDGTRREHTDEWLELLTLASNEGYIEHGKHYTVTDSRKHEQQVLDVHMPSAFTAVMKYVREFNVEGEYTTLSKGDYLDAFRNKSQQDDSYVIDTGVAVRGLKNGRKCVRFDPNRASEKLGSDFTLSAFTEAAAGSDEDVEDVGSDATPVAELQRDGNPYVTVTVECKAWRVGPTAGDGGPAEMGTVQDTTAPIDVVDHFGSITLEEGECYRLENVRVSTYQDSLQLEIVKGTTEAVEIQQGAGYTPVADASEGDAQQAALSDGGTTANKPQKERIQAITKMVDEINKQNSAGAPTELVVSQLEDDGFDADQLRSDIEGLKEKGELHEPREDHLRRT